jgi:hypothetical protein
MGDSSGNSEDQNVHRIEECAPEIGNEGSFRNWTRGDSFYIVAKNLSTIFHALRLCGD